jgi:hypothetical protein
MFPPIIIFASGLFVGLCCILILPQLADSIWKVRQKVKKVDAWTKAFAACFVIAAATAVILGCLAIKYSKQASTPVFIVPPVPPQHLQPAPES